MSRISRFRFASLSMDLTAMLLALIAVDPWTRGADEGMGSHLASVSCYLLVWVLVSLRVGTYATYPGRGLVAALRTPLEAWLVTWAIAGLVDVQVFGGTRIWLPLVVVMTTLATARLLLRHVPVLSLDQRPRVALIGNGSPTFSPSRSNLAHRFHLLGSVALPGEAPTEGPPLCRFENIGHHLAGLDFVFLCPSDQARLGDIHRVFDLCDEARLSVHYFPTFLNLHHLQMSVSRPATEGIGFHRRQQHSLAMLLKRAIDVAGAGLGLLLLFPVFLVVAAAIKLTSQGPIFFRQIRVGENGEHFSCYKFRTMRVGAFAMQEHLRRASVQDGPAFKIPNDPRVTPIGRLLRKFSLDELPQLINVLFGDMSIVGPRPPIPSEVAHYTWWQRRRVSVKPGLTCVWQVWGRNRVSFKRWVEMDLFYIDNWSLWMDLKLIAHTFGVVLKGTGM